jgi:uncharacterized membrane protein
MAEATQRLEKIESRLARIEQSLGLADAQTPGATTPQRPSPAMRPVVPGPLPRRPPARPSPGPKLDATKLMGWSASLAFILAATYFVKLVYDAGWLTPERQIGLAALSGLGLIALGLAIARVDRAYAPYLPAVGIVVLYVSIYAGHTFYHFFGLYPAMAGVAAITFVAIWLGRRFDNSVYALLAVVGTYLTPLLVESARSNVIDLVVYFSAWGLLFSFVALQEMRRRVYLLALFFALFGFDIAFRMTDESAWQTAVVYQFIQFLIFSATAACYSIRHQKPMENVEALLHGLALFYFYIIEFILLKQHIPEWAPLIALASVVIVLGLFFAARRAIHDPTSIRGGAVLVSSYCSVVTAHVLFFELMPDGWHAWAALLLPIGFGLAQYRVARLGGAFLPALAVGMLIFSLGFLEALVARPSRSDIPFPGPCSFSMPRRSTPPTCSCAAGRRAISRRRCPCTPGISRF